MLKSDNIDSFRNGDYPLEMLPQTLRDAVVLTRYLGLQYLWIDALCIIQDSPEDWAAEAARMKEVYGGATITIAATGSKTSTDGMLKPRAISTPLCELHWTDSLRSKVFLRSSLSFWDTTMKREPLNTRGWTLQESMLSPRTLSFGTQQMTWECQELRVGENGRPILPGERHRDKQFIQSLATNRLSLVQRSKFKLARFSLQVMPSTHTIVPQSWELFHHALYSRWYEIVNDFTGRNLTVGSDVLPALSGIASAFHNLLDDHYCAGIWKGDLIRGLLWHRGRIQNHQRPLTATTSRRLAEGHHVPSWSWASIGGGRVFNALAAEKTWQFITVEEIARISKVATTLRFDDPYGQTSDGFLDIVAPFCLSPELSLYFDSTDKIFSSTPLGTSHLERRLQTEMTIDRFRDEFKQQHKAFPGQSFAVIRLMKHSRSSDSNIETIGEIYMPEASFLVLETTGKTCENYRRVGYFTVSVPMYPDPDDENVVLLEEMESAKWPWKKVRIV